MDHIREDIKKQPSNLKPFPTTPEQQLGLALYRLAHGRSFSTLADLFGVSISLAGQTFNKVTRVLVTRLYDTVVVLPKNQAEWGTELKNFIENYEFPCVGAWDDFHVYVYSKLKSNFNFKKRHTVPKLALVGYNKPRLYAAVGAPRSTHDARMLQNRQLYQKLLKGDAIPKLNICLEGAGTVPVVTIGDSGTFMAIKVLQGGY